MSDRDATDLQPFLASSAIIDWKHPAVMAQAARLRQGGGDASAVADRCFAFVRDHIAHSLDHRRNPVTCSASEVLSHGTGYCYAKSHLLAALLRANGLPAGLCYQRLAMADDTFCLHGLNALWLADLGWYRLDARGDRPASAEVCALAAHFTPPQEQLAYRPSLAGERDVAGVWAEPLPAVVAVLRTWNTWQEVAANLPDWSEP